MSHLLSADIAKFGKPDMKAVKLVLKMQKHKRRPWRDVLPEATPLAIEMIDRCRICAPFAPSCNAAFVPLLQCCLYPYCNAACLQNAIWQLCEGGLLQLCECGLLQVD